MHNKNSIHSYPLPGYTFLQSFCYILGLESKQSTIYQRSSFTSRFQKTLFSIVFFRLCCVRSSSWDCSWPFVFDSWETVYQRFTKQDYARKFDLWSVACCIFITECSSFIYEFVVIFPAHMWKNRLLNLGRSGQRGVRSFILTSIFRSWSLS